MIPSPSAARSARRGRVALAAAVQDDQTQCRHRRCRVYLVQWLRAHAGQGPRPGSKRSGRPSARAKACAPTAAAATNRRGQPSSRRRVGDADQRFGQAMGMGVFGVWEPRDWRAHAQQVGDREAVGTLCVKTAREGSAHSPSSTHLWRQIKLRAASSFGQPRSIGGHVHSPIFHPGSRSCRQSWRRSGGQESTRRRAELCEQHRSRRPEPSVSDCFFVAVCFFALTVPRVFLACAFFETERLHAACRILKPHM